MSDPRNVAHAKKVTQEKKHHGAEEAKTEDGHVAQPGKKLATRKKKGSPTESTAVDDGSSAGGSADASETPTAKTPATPATLEGSLIVLAKLKEMEFHSRAHLERLAELGLTIEDELKQKEIVAPLGEVYSAQNAFQTKLTELIETYKALCEQLQGHSL